ncbi:MAG: hypothetical protein JWM26_1183 [Betaproteobacteria bacterium]|nr:hypothetical protein [Betaproteobacteria bacterium]
MKRTQLLVLSVLALGLQGVAQASPFPADAEASYNLPAISSYAEQHAGDTWTSAQSSFPADAEASYGMPGGVTHAEQHAGDALSPGSVRTQDVMAFRGNLDN